MGLNKFTGEYPIEIGGTVYALRYSWAALAELQAELGVEYDTAISTALSTQDVKTLSIVISCGLDGALSAKDVYEASPQLMATSAAVTGAILFAYYGTAGAPPPEKVKKKMFQRVSTFWNRLLKRPADPV